jgi:hypothetical protein
MEKLKAYITNALALVSINYTEPIQQIIILVDRSKKG